MQPRLKILLASLAVLVVLLAGGLYLGYQHFFGDDAPAEVDLATAVAGLGSTTTTAPATTTTAAGAGSTTTAGSGTTAAATATTAAASGVTGAWSVDNQSGEFDYESATGTFAGFRIAEELSGIGSTTAVGRTGDVSGTMQIDGTKLTAATFEVDLTTITTNESRRDDKVQQALDTGDFPTATFTLTQPVDMGAGAATGGPVSVTAVGDLTIHGVTKQVSFPLEAQLVGGTVVVVGSLDITFADFGVSVPSAPIVVSAAGNGPLEVQILFTRA